jgi:hypothetical protein
LFVIWFFSLLVRIFFFFLTTRPNEGGLGDYHEIEGKAITDLGGAAVKIEHIIGDNHAVPVMVHWGPKSLTESKGDRLDFQACLCHVLCLVIADAFAQSPTLKHLDDNMVEIISARSFN